MNCDVGVDAMLGLMGIGEPGRAKNGNAAYNCVLQLSKTLKQ